MQIEKNNSRLEYRAWNKQYKTMSTVTMFLFSTNEIDTDDNNGEPKNIEYYEIMQFTGLRDKNKIKIFEGDILKIKLPCGGFWGKVSTDKIGIVRYEPDFGGYIVEWEYSRHQHHEQLGRDIAFESEILGNIFKNPDKLLVF